MTILVPNYILTPDILLTDKAIAFDRTIRDIGDLEELEQKFPEAKTIQLQKNSLLMPGLINAHVHVEFSANKNQLSYGDFLNWLYSVIENREDLIAGCDLTCMTKAIDAMLASGITTFGAISSHAMDLEACVNAKQNVVFFNELIGSQAGMADALFSDFLARLDTSKAVQREGFYPAVAIHSPYSVHPILIQKALEIVKNENLKLTAHFMESEAERNWLDSSSGDFKKFFQTLLKQNKSVSDAKEFLDYFNDYETLLTHAVTTNDEELEQIAQQKHIIIHCPISNRLLGNPTLDIQKLNEKKIRWIVATDGLSSNYQLDLFEEMKISLFMHSDAPLLEFAKQLIKGVTLHAAQSLGLNTGEIQEGKNADMIVLDLDAEPNEELAVHLILHRYNISKVFINGKLVKGNE
ncbi:metal-dependent hydrolase [Sulfurimonas sp. SWIR-19]|uniref:aminofutalosine deaminase family hydrolase n=1 Tax=Sulfurimonas sp. SWIR-19 TaxID=2878390 RepID=UPI001CF1F3EC|nr:metal-dependent hydrolase [Sulfurimonas sp. SWIR-19]UCN01039.1 metal-dependent hydrolase [Sulfurimonas sp. SWIR-19]